MLGVITYISPCSQSLHLVEYATARNRAQTHRGMMMHLDDGTTCILRGGRVLFFLIQNFHMYIIPSMLKQIKKLHL